MLKKQFLKKRTLQIAAPVVAVSFFAATHMTVAHADTMSTYTVQAGDTLWKISQAYHISLASLEAANPQVTPRDMLIGTVLNLPVSSRTSSSIVANTNQINSSSSPTANADYSEATYNSNLYWLAHLISAEAQGTPLNAQIAVGDVVWNRMQNPDYPNTAYGVIFQKTNGYAQFTCTTNGFIYQTPVASAWTAAKDVLDNHENLVPNAYVFYNPSKTASNSWVWDQPTIEQIGPFIFAQ